MGHYKGYSKNNFEYLLETLTTIQGKFLLSSYPSVLLKEFTQQFPWYTQQFEQLVSVNAKTKSDKKKTEVLTANYPLVPNPNQMILF